MDSLDNLRAITAQERLDAANTHKTKLEAIAAAQADGHTKDAIARNLGISRPTLDAWIRDRDDRILFNDALAILTHPTTTNAKADTPAHSEPGTRALDLMYNALGVRDTKAQAAAVLEGVHHLNRENRDALTTEKCDVIQQATARAWQLM